MLAALEGTNNHSRAILHIARGVDNNVNVRGVAEQQRIIRDGNFAGRDGHLDLAHCGRTMEMLQSAIAERLLGLRDGPIGNGGEADSRKRLNELRGDSPAHIARADDSYPNRMAFLFPSFQGCINNDHDFSVAPDMRASFLVLKVRPRSVGVRNRSDRKRPANAERGIVEAHPTRRFRRIESRCQVFDLARVHQSLIAVRAALRNVERAAVLTGELECVPELKSRRVRTQVHHDVKHSALRTPHRFGFFVRPQLIMHPANARAFRRVAHVDLNKTRVQTVGFEFLRAPGTGEKSAMVFAAFKVDKESAFHFGFRKPHRRQFTQRSRRRV